MAKDNGTTADTTEEAPVTKRLGDLTGGIGNKLEQIKGETVTVYSIEFTNRPVHALDEAGRTTDALVDKDIAILTCDNGNRFYTLSEPLIGKLREIDQDELPALAVFNLKEISGGRRVWTIE